ncbi:MAG: tryptophan synthase subunit alpha [Candidatus Marinimicrobia bacterium]|nr:tryptophan synthase subunit alpha [Candidatus Neomarinimicrobiota bacterium]
MNYHNVYINLKKEGKIAFLPFTILGFPNFETSLSVIQTLIENGADILELGFPFSDPVADGPIIQEANNIALHNNINTEKCLTILEKIRKFSPIPIGLLVYANLVFTYGTENFYKRLQELKINSVLIPDIPPEESEEYRVIAQKYGIQTVFIITPVTPKERIDKICQMTTGFIYLVSRLGVTGTHEKARIDLAETIKTIRQVSNLPINVGFGISDPSHFKNLKQVHADGGIIGSAIIKQIQNSLSDIPKMQKELKNYLQQISAQK